ncbi:adenylosuccinate lyase [Patescibacteria group bacterium]|nr:adenylosuccinate lyase [Patescibacteria group bacterium]
MDIWNSLTALSPLDGRYRSKVQELYPYFSEYGLIRYRLMVEIEYLIALSDHPHIPLRPFTENERLDLRALWNISPNTAQLIKDIETRGYGPYTTGTNHDVKAIELYLRMKLADTSLSDVLEWIHICLTSEDVNNFAYALMLHGAIAGPMGESLNLMVERIDQLAKQYANVAMLARTHGQAATPTTLGKELNVFDKRQIEQLLQYHLSVKLNGASGNYNAFEVAFPRVGWIQFSEKFARRFDKFDDGLPFEVNYVTTQIESHDTYAELFDILRRINSIGLDFCQDIWRYVSDNWLVQKPKEGEVGSSTMPHKVNPIDFENAEGNFGIANALLEFFSRKLLISRLQRDLSDSTVERNFGVAFAYSLLGYKSLQAGLRKVSANQVAIDEYLETHPEVITEAYQTILRRENYPNAYDALKSLARGKKIAREDLENFVHALPVSNEVKEEMLAITPANYIGLSARWRECDVPKNIVKGQKQQAAPATERLFLCSSY